MRVAGDGINFATDFLKLGVFVGKVFKLRRTNEREIGGVEEKHAPLAQNVRFAHRVEVVVLVRLHGEFANL